VRALRPHVGHLKADVARSYNSLKPTLPSPGAVGTSRSARSSHSYGCGISPLVRSVSPHSHTSFARRRFFQPSSTSGVAAPPAGQAAATRPRRATLAVPTDWARKPDPIRLPASRARPHPLQRATLGYVSHEGLAWRSVTPAIVPSARARNRQRGRRFLQGRSSRSQAEGSFARSLDR